MTNNFEKSPINFIFLSCMDLPSFPNHFKYCKLLICILVLIGALQIKAQTGNYYITNYTPANYHAGDQNKGVAQDKYGRILLPILMVF